ncbi:hypothetical protein [Streptomyces sp. CA2R101]|uniref:hypothetical protein n=1 Tax=Streptomyces sp. CA2R101 TaxID=3120152 RepID=UPI003008A0C7
MSKKKASCDQEKDPSHKCLASPNLKKGKGEHQSGSGQRGGNQQHDKGDGGLVVTSGLLTRSQRDDLVKQLGDCVKSASVGKIKNVNVKELIKSAKTSSDLNKAHNKADAARELLKNNVPFGGCYLGHVRTVE